MSSTWTTSSSMWVMRVRRHNICAPLTASVFTGTAGQRQGCRGSAACYIERSGPGLLELVFGGIVFGARGVVDAALASGGDADVVDAGLQGGIIQRERRRIQVSGLIDRRSEEHTSELQSLRHLVCRL